MNYVCPMCGHPFGWEDDFGAGGAVVCPACGTHVAGPVPVLAPIDTAAASRKVQAPAVALMVVGGFTIVNGLASVALGVLALVMEREQGAPPEDAVIGAVAQGIGAVFSFAIGGIIIAGGLKMYRLQSWGFALAASILSVIPCTVCCLFGMPIGIWSLVTLNDPEVKEAFT